MYTNVKFLCCQAVEALEFFKQMGLRYGNKNAVTQKV